LWTIEVGQPWRNERAGLKDGDLSEGACHNVAGGFEGPLDDERHRGTAGGWKAAGLPWLQG
jgi:hypothetical protein